MGKSKDLATLKSGLSIDGTLETTSVGTNLTSNSYNIVRVQTDKDDTAAADGILQFTHGSSNTVKGEIRYDASESMFELGHGDNQGHVRIDGSGRVTKPNQPYGRANGSVGSTVSHANGDVINWFQSQVAQGGMSFSNNGRWTVPVAGTYLIHAKCYSYDTRAGHANISLRKNGSAIAFNQCEFGGDVYSGRLDWHISLTSIYNASANDYFDLTTSTTPSPWAWYRGGTNNAFEVYLLG
mgnify:CR=1 FL=1